NVVTSKNQHEMKDNEEEWDFRTSIIVTAPPNMTEEEFDFDDRSGVKEKNEKALVATRLQATDYNNDWIIDSGFSNHMIGVKDKL
ncbi:unnamed protein product, partial [Dovyalis caffra]